MRPNKGKCVLSGLFSSEPFSLQNILLSFHFLRTYCGCLASEANQSTFCPRSEATCPKFAFQQMIELVQQCPLYTVFTNVQFQINAKATGPQDGSFSLWSWVLEKTIWQISREMKRRIAKTARHSSVFPHGTMLIVFASTQLVGYHKNN